MKKNIKIFIIILIIISIIIVGTVGYFVLLKKSKIHFCFENNYSNLTINLTLWIDDERISTYMIEPFYKDVVGNKIITKTLPQGKYTIKIFENEHNIEKSKTINLGIEEIYLQIFCYNNDITFDISNEKPIYQ